MDPRRMAAMMMMRGQGSSAMGGPMPPGGGMPKGVDPLQALLMEGQEAGQAGLPGLPPPSSAPSLGSPAQIESGGAQPDPMAAAAAQRAAGGAQGASPGLVQALMAWLASKRGDVGAARGVDEAANAALPDALSGRSAVLRKRQQYQQMDDMARGQ